MKKTSLKKSAGKSVKSTQSKIAKPASAPQSPQKSVSDTPTFQSRVTHLEMPPPEYLLELAENEPDETTLHMYSDTINALRRKGRSFRDIAQWMCDNGVEIDHNAVYRIYNASLTAYKASLTDEELYQLKLREEEEEAHRAGS